MPAAAVPIAASVAAPMLAEGATAALGTTALSGLMASAPSWLMPAITGAGMGGIGSLLTGQSPLKGALMGGIGGGLSSALDLGSLFGGGVNPSADLANETISPALKAADGTLANAVSQPSFLQKIGPSAALGLGAMALDRSSSPKSIGPLMQEHPQSKPVRPLDRVSRSVDPNSYFTSGGNRNFYDPYQMQPEYFADGGAVKNRIDRGDSDIEQSNMLLAKMGENHPMIDAVAHIVNRYNKDRVSGYPGSIISYAKDEYGDVPVTREMMKAYKGYAKGGAVSNTKKFFETKMKNDPKRHFDKYSKSRKIEQFDDGGSASTGHSTLPVGLGRLVKGRGDGRSDQIPAMLSDGEFVFSSPAVSALGNGSNDAGAKKLSKMQKNIITKHYKGGKPQKALGLGAYH